MKKRIKTLGLMLSLIIGLSTFAVLKLNKFTVNAYTGLRTDLTEKELYNETNTYDVSDSNFNERGVFSPTNEAENSTRRNKTQYNLSYDLSVRKDREVMNAAQITVLTHGLDCDASVWSNNFTKEEELKEFTFKFDASSLINVLKNKNGGANVYWVKMTGFNAFNLYDITECDGEYTELNITNAISDISKHIIVVFDADWEIESETEDEKITGSKESNNNVYYQFNYMLSKIIYDVKQLNGGVLPKVNLIGHSRGGITNLQYALDHPDLVASMVSIGTPFFGSTTARLLGEEYTDASDGLDDILDAQLYYGYNNRWNNNYERLYKNISAYAIGSYHTLSSLKEVLDNSLYKKELPSDNILKDIINALSGLKKFCATFPTHKIAERLTKELKYAFPEEKAVALAQILVNELVSQGWFSDVIWENDVLVPLDSQLGKDGGSETFGGGDYIGFKRAKRLFSEDDEYVNYSKISEPAPAVGHNLEARDKSIVALVPYMLKLGVNEDPAFVTAENSDGTISVIRYNGTAFDAPIIVPQTLNGKCVTSIGSSAFMDTEATEIRLPSSIKRIGSYAFAGADNLSKIEINGYGLEYIGSHAFAGCAALSSFNSVENGKLYLPSTVTTIGEFAFYGTAFQNIVLNNNLSSIGGAAFSGCENLQNITIPASNAHYTIENNNIYNKNKTEIVAVLSPSDVFSIASNVTSVKAYAFDNDSVLETLHIYGAPTIENFAFSNCENLTNVYFYSFTVPAISPHAFAEDTFTMYGPYCLINEYRDRLYNKDSVILGYMPITISLFDGEEPLNSINSYFGAERELSVPEKGGYTFAGWYLNSDFSGSTYQNEGYYESWQDFALYSKWTQNKYYITFIGYNYPLKEVTFDEMVGELPQPTEVGHTFWGWKDNSGQYITQNYVWRRAESISVTADLRANEYVITFDGNGGSVNSESLSVTYGVVTGALPSGYKEGHAFIGWNTMADGSGENFTDGQIYSFDSDIILYAQYSAEQYDVSFDKEGGSGGSIGVTAIFGEPMPTGSDMVAPIKPGYTFNGYYQSSEGKGIKYYNADMSSNHVWNIAGGATLFAAWEPNKYIVTFDKQGGMSNVDAIEVTYGESMPSGGSIPQKSGYIFKGYYANVGVNDVCYYDNNMQSANKWNIPNNATLVAHWVPATYNVTLDRCGGTGGDTQIIVTYMADMPAAMAPSMVGYTFKGYYTRSDGQGQKFYDEDMSSAQKWNVTSGTTLYAYFVANVYTITFDFCRGSGQVRGLEVRYNEILPSITCPSLEFYLFDGYYESENGLGFKYYNSNGTSSYRWKRTANITVYANWNPNYYTVQYNYITFNGKIANLRVGESAGSSVADKFTCGRTLDLTKITPYFETDSAYSPQMRFLGWFTNESFSTEASNTTSSIVVWAKWRYDYDNPGRSGTYTITDDGPFNQGSRYDTVSIGLNTGIYQQLKNLGIKYLTINFKIRMWEVYDGYQEIYVYGGSGSGNLLWSKTDIEHGGSGKSTSPAVYNYRIDIDINKLSNVDTLYIRYSAHGAGKDDWQTDKMYCELSYVVSRDDIYGSGVPAFYWSYQDPFK